MICGMRDKIGYEAKFGGEPLIANFYWFLWFTSGSLPIFSTSRDKLDRLLADRNAAFSLLMCVLYSKNILA